MPLEIIAGITLAALAIPEVVGYTKISGTPVITGLYTILAAGLVGLASVGSGQYVALAAVLAILAEVLSLLDHVHRGYRPKNTVIATTESGGWRTTSVNSADPSLSWST